MFDTNASLGLGRNMTVVEKATYFAGINAYGKALIGGVTGNYEIAALGNLTPNSKCKENGCGGDVGEAGGRSNNLPVCPIPTSQGNLLYITLSGGGLLIGKTDTTPMTIVAEYGSNIVYGAGCGGAEVGKVMYLNSGVSAAPSGLNQSDFSLWAFDSSKYMDVNVTFQPENKPLPSTVFNDNGNTATLGNLQGQLENPSGQLPSKSTRRDSHGIVAIDGNYVHTFDRIQAEAYVIDTATNTGSFAYSLRNSSVCKGFTDDTNLPEDDPAPDLLETTPDGLYLVIAFRGPAPVTFAHTTQGSCPGVGIVKLDNGGRNGKLITVLRTTNLTPDSISVVVPGGVNYVGKERSDIHMVATIDRNKWAKSAKAKAEKTKSPQAKAAGKKTVFNL